MGEKSGGMFLMVISLVIGVAILLVASVAFPDMTTNITDGMNGIIENAVNDAGGINTGGSVQ